MAWRPTPLVQSGELDNTLLGWTVGWLVLQGVADPLRLKLAGNCHPDLAGWKFKIHRIAPEIPDEFDDDPIAKYSGIGRDQTGHVGDITAEQMTKHFDMSTHELLRRMRANEKPPFVWRKRLYLEWFSNQNGRVVIESTRLEVVRLGERSFELTESQWLEQSRQNVGEMDYFMLQLGNTYEADCLPLEEDDI